MPAVYRVARKVAEAMPLRPLNEPQRARRVLTCVSPSIVRIIPSLTATCRTPMSSGRIFRCTPSPAACSTCLDGPIDTSTVVLEWGDTTGAPILVSGQIWGEGNLLGRPAILDSPVGNGHIITFNFNPIHRDLNRGDQRMLWNAILNWQSILAAPSK